MEILTNIKKSIPTLKYQNIKSSMKKEGSVKERLKMKFKNKNKWKEDSKLIELVKNNYKLILTIKIL